MNTPPLSFAVVGMNGYSRVHINSILELKKDIPAVSLAGVSTRRRSIDDPYARRLEQAGAQIVASLDALLAIQPTPTVICIPTGIHLHRPMATQALRAGCAVIMEKPVAATIQDVDALIAERDRAAKPLIVGFQHLSQERYWYAKTQLDQGLIGRIVEVRGLAAAPRYLGYYQRTAWAGKLKEGDTWVLDSPINNAHAHYLLQCLLFAGTPGAVAQPVSISAELYRAQAIEGPDTAALQIDTDNEIPIRFLASHSVDQSYGPEVTVIGDAARLIVTPDTMIVEKNGSREPLREPENPGNPFRSMIGLLQDNNTVPYCSLEQARPHTLCVNGAHLSSPVVPVPNAFIDNRNIPATDTAPADRQVYVRHLFEAMNRAYTVGGSLHDDDNLPWTKPGQPVDLRQLSFFNAPLDNR